MLLECLRLQRASSNGADLPVPLKLADTLIRILVQERDALLTDTLAEELSTGLKVFLNNIVLSNQLYVDYFSNNEHERSTMEMLEDFICQVRELESNRVDCFGRRHDTEVKNKGNPRKG